MYTSFKDSLNIIIFVRQSAIVCHSRSVENILRPLVNLNRDVPRVKITYGWLRSRSYVFAEHVSCVLFSDPQRLLYDQQNSHE
jgi:hypothetical protein